MTMSTSPSLTTNISSPLSPLSKIFVPAAKDLALEVSANMLFSVIKWFDELCLGVSHQRLHPLIIFHLTN